MIHVEHLEKSFGSVRAVADISFDVKRGEVIGLLGPNGAGKTTTMRILTGFLVPDKGSVTIDGLSVADHSLETRQKIGYLPESAPVYLDLEVTTYLEYIATLRDLPHAERSKRIRHVVELCGLKNVVGRPIGQLSKGYRQRVGIAQALIHEPPLLILDEPTSGLDPNQIVDIRKLIRDIGQERTVILSTHILQEVEATCSRALIIHGGKLVGQGTLNELMQLGSGTASYVITAKTKRTTLSQALQHVGGLSVSQWLTSENESNQRVMLRATNGADRSEALFDMAVKHGFPLTELRKETASLEQVFRELTQ